MLHPRLNPKSFKNLSQVQSSLTEPKSFLNLFVSSIIAKLNSQPATPFEVIHSNQNFSKRLRTFNLPLATCHLFLVDLQKEFPENLPAFLILFKMLKIRFQRIGRKKLPFFRIVVAEKARSAKAKFVEILGNFNPQTKELNLKKERIEHWVSNGAQPSDRIAQILVKNSFKNCEKFITERKMKPTRAEQKAAEEAKKAAEEKATEKPAESSAEKSEKESAPAEKPAEEKPEEPAGKSDSSESDEKANAEKPENKDESAEEKK